MRLFKDRVAAAEELAEHLHFLKQDDPIILALANGGVPLAEVLAEQLEAPLDLLFIENLYSPKVPSQAVGAIDEHGRISMIAAAARWHHLTSQQLIAPAREVFKGLYARAARIREVLPELDVAGRTVIIVSHGVAAGASMLGAIASARDRGARRVVAAAPAGAEKAIWQLHEAADVVVIPHRPAKFKGIAHFYQHYTEVSDALVEAIVNRWLEKRGEEPTQVRTVVLKIKTPEGVKLHCELDLPPSAERGAAYPAVIFAHGMESHGGSSRSMPISQRLARRGVIGVRPDFTGHGFSEGATEDCTEDRMLSDLSAVYDRVRQVNEISSHCIGVNGSGAGGMTALRFAAAHPELQALVIRGPVAGDEPAAAQQVTAPTLLIHAEQDTALLDAIEKLDHDLAATHRLLTIPEATRIFMDPISRELMVNASVDWFVDHLRTAPEDSQADTPALASQQAADEVGTN